MRYTRGGHSCIRGAAAILLLTLAACGRAEPRSPGSSGAGEAPWAAHLKTMDEALAEKDVSAAEWAWFRAHGAALGSRGWEGMLAVGDAALRIGAVAGGRQATQSKARSVYLAALFRARSHRSVDGVLKTAEAFRALGDREVVQQCLVIARRLVEEDPDPGARARALALTDQFTARLRGAEDAEHELF